MKENKEEKSDQKKEKKFENNKKEENKKDKNDDNKKDFNSKNKNNELLIAKDDKDLCIIDYNEKKINDNKNKEKYNIINQKKEEQREKDKNMELIINNKKDEKKNIIKEKEEKYKMERLFDDDEKTTIFFSVMLLGGNQVGKSWIFDNIFSIPFTTSPSFCLDSEEIFIKINEDIISLKIEDCPGQDLFFKLNLSSIGNKDLIIFVYSIDSRESFEIIIKRIKETKQKCNENTHFILVGNKLDLNDIRTVSKEEGSELAKNENLDLFMEVSAKYGENIEQIIFEASKILYKNRK